MTESTGQRQTGQLLTLADLADYLQVPRKTLYVWRHKGSGPRGVKVGKHIRYRMADVEAWLDQQAEAVA